ncbi:MAG TPA: hypothetical protein VM282_21050 [Acidimicrobiales bacterium]|nr:hypothetical protein [Acidimicrobiales bacterium]
MQTQHTIIDALEAEWPVVASSSDARTRLATWRIAEPDLAEFPTIGVVVAEIQRRDQPDSVRAMGALVRLATSEPLARRAVLQVMIPVMCGRIRAVRDVCARSGVEIDLDEASQSRSATMRQPKAGSEGTYRGTYETTRSCVGRCAANPCGSVSLLFAA